MVTSLREYVRLVLSGALRASPDVKSGLKAALAALKRVDTVRERRRGYLMYTLVASGTTDAPVATVAVGSGRVQLVNACATFADRLEWVGRVTQPLAPNVAGTTSRTPAAAAAAAAPPGARFEVSVYGSTHWFADAVSSEEIASVRAVEALLSRPRFLCSLGCSL
jgi:hypothetical protein